MQRLHAFFLLGCIFSFLPWPTLAQDIATNIPTEDIVEVTPSVDLEATITAIIADETVDGIRQVQFRAEDAKGVTYDVSTEPSMAEGLHFDLREGDRVVLQIISNLDGTTTAYFADVVRVPALGWVFAIFAFVTIAVGLRRGLLALVGFAFTLAVLFGVVFPRILAGADPVITTAVAGIVILAANLLLSHGATRSTGVAFASVSMGVVCCWLFSTFSIWLARLSGLSSEESVFLYWQFGAVQNPAGLLLAGIILGAVGVLDDVAVTQCETVAELKAANPRLHGRELFVRAMRIGRHHIASTVNTLMLAYAGSALPLLLIFMADDSVSVTRFFNTEAVAEEIVRTLAGTTALVLTVPIATLFAALVWRRATPQERTAFVEHEHGP